MINALSELISAGLKIVQRVILLVGIFYIIITIFIRQLAPPVKQSQNIDTLQIYRQNLYNVLRQKPINNTQAISIAVQRHFLCLFIGEVCTDNPDDADKNFNASIFGAVANIISFTFTEKPASGIAWIHNGLSEVGFIPKVQAQGIGYAGIYPLSTIWGVFRNISYLLIVLFIVTVGFMIMFRAQINPQTVVSVESALPKLVIALLVITLSFPIAGFLIDLMYIIMTIGVTVIAVQIPNATQLGLTANIYDQGAWNLFSSVLGNGAIWKTGPAIIQFLPTVFQYIIRIIVTGLTFFLLNRIGFIQNLTTGTPTLSIPFIGSLTGSVLAIAATGLIISIIFSLFYSVIISLIVYLTALFVFFRILFLLISTYLQILLMIIFAPIILLFEVIPGKNAFFTWVKNLFTLLLTFPIVAVMFAITTYIATLAEPSTFGEWVGNGDLWRPPFLYAQNKDGFIIIVAVSLLFLIPDLVKYIKESLGVKDLPFNIGLGPLLAGGAIAVGGVFGALQQVRSIQMLEKQHPDKGVFDWTKEKLKAIIGLKGP